MICDEKDYLAVIEIQKENEKLDEHWKECTSKKLWTQINGVCVSFEELTVTHLTNIIGMLSRFYEERSSDALLNLIKALINELALRYEEKEREKDAN